MHIVQQKILNLATTTNLASLKLREIGEQVGEPHPQKIKHHINQLFKNGFLKENRDKTVISRVDLNSSSEDKFIALPILGSANCGEAMIFAEENLEGYLHLSKSVIPDYDQNNMFIVRASGNSMNRARIRDHYIEDGDYLVIDKRVNEDLNNKYVLSIINGMANVKKFVSDEDHNRILLISESTQNLPPIVIHNSDFGDYLVNGKVIQVIKGI